MLLIRILVASVAIEAAVFMAWLMVTGVFGIIVHNQDARIAFYQLFGRPFGLFAGLGFSIYAAHFVARGTEHPLRNGFFTGVAASIVDGAFIFMLFAEQKELLILSSLVRIVGGSVGGWIVHRHAVRTRRCD